MKFRLVCLAFLSAIQLFVGCVDQVEIPPPYSNLPSCGNGICDTNVETCFNCPIDCDCCSAISAFGVVSGTGITTAQQQLVVGESDGQSLTLDDRSEIELALGMPFSDENGEGLDFRLIGNVTTSEEVVDGCSTQISGYGAFEIFVKNDADYEFVGIWSSKRNTFNIGCSSAPQAMWIKIRAQPGASGSLDAILPFSDRVCIK